MLTFMYFIKFVENEYYRIILLFFFIKFFVIYITNNINCKMMCYKLYEIHFKNYTSKSIPNSNLFLKNVMSS